MIIVRIFGIACYFALTVLILGFIFTNRMPVEVSIFPLGHTQEMPLYVLLAILFAAGLMIGLLHSLSVWSSMRSKLKRSERAVAQLEKEIAVKPL